MALPFTDLFTNTNGTLLSTHDSGWTLDLGTAAEIQSNGVQGAGANGIYRWTTDTPEDDQHIEFVYDGDDSNGAVFSGVFVRLNSSGDGYVLYQNGADVYLARSDEYVEGAADSSIGVNLSPGDVVRLSAVGSEIYSTLNGSTEGMPSLTDSTHTSGNFGLVFAGIGSNGRIASVSMESIEPAVHSTDITQTYMSASGMVVTTHANQTYMSGSGQVVSAPPVSGSFTIGTGGDFEHIHEWADNVRALGTLQEDQIGQVIDNKIYQLTAAADLSFNTTPALNGFTVRLEGSGSGVYRHGTGSGARIHGAANVVALGCRDVTIADLFVQSNGTGNNRSAIGYGSRTHLERCVLTGINAANTEIVYLGDTGSMKACLIIGGRRGINVPAGAVDIANCLFIGQSEYGFYGYDATSNANIRNTAVYDCAGTAYYFEGTTLGTYSNNASEDGTHPGTAGILITENPFTSNGFVPTTDGALSQSGTDLSITTDAAGKPYRTPPSIGAYEQGYVRIESMESTANASGLSSITVDKPSGVVSGDLLMMILTNGDNADEDDFPAHTGWVRQFEGGSNTSDAHLAVYTRVSDGTEGVSETVAWIDGTDPGIGWYLRLTGHHPTDYWDTLGTLVADHTSSEYARSITPSVDDCLVFAVNTNDGFINNVTTSGTNWPSTIPPTQSLHAGLVDHTGIDSSWLTQQQTAAAASNDCTFTSGEANADGMLVVQFAIAPAITNTVTRTIGTNGHHTEIDDWTDHVKALDSLTQNQVGTLIDNKVYDYSGSYSDLDFSSVTLDGYTITLKADPSVKHNGNFGNGARIETFGVSGGRLFDPKYLIIEDFSIYNLSTGSNTRVLSLAQETTYSRCIFKCAATFNAVIGYSSGTTGSMYSCRAEGGAIGFDFGENTTINAYNNTAVNTLTGFRTVTTNTGDLQNNATYNCTTGFSGTFNGTCSNNASEDDTAPGNNTVLLTGNPFEANGYTPLLNGELDSRGAYIGVTETADGHTFDSPPSIGAYEVGKGANFFIEDEIIETPNQKPNYPVEIDWGHPLSSGLIGYWSFGHMQRYIDLARGNHAFPVGVVDEKPEYVDTDPDNTAYIQIDDPNAIYGDDSKGLTVITLLPLNAKTNYDKLITKKGLLGWGDAGWSISLATTEDEVSFTTDANESATYDTGSSIIGKQYIYTIRSTGSNPEFFLDGEVVGSLTNGTGTPNTEPMTIGWWPNVGKTSESADVDAKFLMIFHRALSDVEIKQIIGNPYAFLKPAIPNYFGLERAANLTDLFYLEEEVIASPQKKPTYPVEIDWSEVGSDKLIFSLLTDYDPTPDLISGTIGEAFLQERDQDHIRFSGNYLSYLDTGVQLPVEVYTEFSVEVLFKPNSAHKGVMIEQGDTYRNGLFYIALTAAGEIGVNVKGDEGSDYSVTESSEDAYTAGEWCHVVLSWGAGAFPDLYVNAVLDNASTAGATQDFAGRDTGDTTIHLGTRPSGDTDDGSEVTVAYVNIYNKKLSQAEIRHKNKNPYQFLKPKAPNYIYLEKEVDKIVNFFVPVHDDVDYEVSRKPTEAMEIDWSHPLAKDLIFCTLMQDKAGYNLAGGRELPVMFTHNAITYAVDKYGKCISSNTSTSDIALRPYSDNAMYDLGSEYTVSATIISIDITSSFIMYSGHEWNDGGYGIFIDTSGTRFTHIANGTDRYWTGLTLASNTKYTITFRRKGTLGELFINGVSQGTDNTFGATDTLMFSNVLSRYPSGDYALVGRFHETSLHRRWLNDAEVMSLHKNPYAFLKGVCD